LRPFLSSDVAKRAENLSFLTSRPFNPLRSREILRSYDKYAGVDSRKLGFAGIRERRLKRAGVAQEIGTIKGEAE
jgi:hypothetical protein